MLLKAYFDGGNKADSTQHDTATLAFVAAKPNILRRFERAWNSVLKKHGALFLHTTDILASHPVEPYIGWDATKRDEFMQDCASLMAEATEWDHGSLLPYAVLYQSITIDLKDFIRARNDNTNVSESANEVLAEQAFGHAMMLGHNFGVHFWELFFDRNEPYRGHFVDRLEHSRWTRWMKDNGLDVERRFIIEAELNMRDVPALQAADLLAWCLGQSEDPKYEWQRIIMNMPRGHELMTYQLMVKPDPIHVELKKQFRWNFPNRAATR